MKIKNKAQARKRRHFRIRRKVAGTADVPRMAVYVSHKHMYVQFIDDQAGRTLAQVSTSEKDLGTKGATRTAAQHIGRVAGERAVACGIRSVVFDRGGFGYGMRLSALADAAREAGLKF
jgi:large subunit ribosomal protein L18